MLESICDEEQVNTRQGQETGQGQSEEQGRGQAGVKHRQQRLNAQTENTRETIQDLTVWRRKKNTIPTPWSV